MSRQAADPFQTEDYRTPVGRRTACCGSPSRLDPRTCPTKLYYRKRGYPDEAMMHGFERDDPAVRGAWRELLLQYCRLDTLAMVLIWEHWMRQTGGLQ